MVKDGPVELIHKGKRIVLVAKAAKIAIDHFGATEVIKVSTPPEIGTKTIPYTIAPISSIEEVIPEVKKRKPRAKK
jgi:hypothetical protein